MLPLRSTSAWRTILHGVQQTMDQVGGGGVVALHEALLNTLHDGVAFPVIKTFVTRNNVNDFVTRNNVDNSTFFTALLFTGLFHWTFYKQNAHAFHSCED